MPARSRAACAAASPTHFEAASYARRDTPSTAAPSPPAAASRAPASAPPPLPPPPFPPPPRQELLPPCIVANRHDRPFNPRRTHRILHFPAHLLRRDVPIPDRHLRPLSVRIQLHERRTLIVHHV